MKIFILLLLVFGLSNLNQANAQTKKSSVKKTTTKPVAKKTKSVTKSTNDDVETYNGHKVYTGPRGGKYYINSRGNKTYIKH